MDGQFLPHIQAALADSADAGRAASMRAYMRGQFDFLGVPTPARRAATRAPLSALKGAGADALLEHACALWQLPQREYQYLALDLLAMHWKELDASHLPALLALAQRRAWWDSVDGVAAIVGDLLRREKTHGRDAHGSMDAALGHADLWVRRIAMTHQLGWRGDTDAARLFAYALALAPETEFFIQKALGWGLRDYAWHDPAAVRGFLAASGERLAPLSRREAGKHLSLP
ncbi:DNA alkylation repair protein [Janthinobacterium fluminis]|uniref:DNA alkylation repair protein n=1 Tax=Janthinobacterium fluminis TaxID=2987524 RepID=A0ABT5JW74_9BURK|nr:DNA alkylation repair protein [Janthinobacterium fluminis]MDC8756741.1 DNA alkylation repair protein [Janthinobacterium fluminis]